MFERLQEIVLNNEKFLSEQEEPEVIQLIYAYYTVLILAKKATSTFVKCQLQNLFYQYLLTNRFYSY